MHGLIFETSVWLLAESTRLLPSRMHGLLWARSNALCREGSKRIPPLYTLHIIVRACTPEFHFEREKNMTFFTQLMLPSSGDFYKTRTRLELASIRGHQKALFSLFSLLSRRSCPHKKVQKRDKYLIPFRFLALIGPRETITIGKPMAVLEDTCCVPLFLVIFSWDDKNSFGVWDPMFMTTNHLQIC